jgi:hypothetical protein
MLNTISSGIVPNFLPKCTYHNMHHDVMGGFAFKLVVATFRMCQLFTCPKTTFFLTPNAYHI